MASVLPYPFTTMGLPKVKALLSDPSRQALPIELHGLLPEPLFVRALRLERKRAERSRKLFVLMVVDVAGRPRNGDTKALLWRSVPAILSSIRETDVAGWHQDQTALGVIFAELGPADEKTIVSALRTKVTAVLQSGLSAEELAGLRITFHRFPEDWDEKDGLPIEKLYPDLVQRDESRKLPRAIKRGIDILGSAIALLLVSPILMLVALAIRVTSPGPILFRQKRIGQYGVPFTCLKFRSMYTGNDQRIHMDYVKQFIAGNNGHGAVATNGKSQNSNGKRDIVYKITKDPRLTRVGQFLRKTSLDELPQFLNVLRGDMSLVGPRPPIPYELEAYDIWHRRRLLEVKPGITGLWQVTGRSRIAFDDMVRLDLRYATTWSLWLDVKILLRTPQAVFSGEGAY
jgi:lipopolysaccharide/colanic/teichoic acid biosynthesis glycosyltransferase